MAYSTISGGLSGTFGQNPTAGGSETYIDSDSTHTLTGSGVLNSVSVLTNSAISTFKIGTTSTPDGASFTTRDYEILASLSSGENTITGLNIEAELDDCLAYYWSDGSMKWAGSADMEYKSGDWVASFNNTGVIDTDGSFPIYATGVTVPDAPTDVVATDNLPDKVTITWTAGTGEAGGHTVYREGVDISGVVAHGTATYDDTTAVAETTYAYTVKAINDAGLSAASSADNGTKIASSFIPQILVIW